MLTPALIRANYKVAGSLEVALESIIGSNLPLMFPEVYLFNRSTGCSMSISGVREVQFVNQADPDFNGTVTQTLFSTSLAPGQKVRAAGLDNSLLPIGYGVSTALIIANTGPDPDAMLTILVKGLIDTSIANDPRLVVNVLD